jgi:LysM repeat protein
MRNIKRIIYLLTAIGMLAGCTVSYSSAPTNGTAAATHPHEATSPADATMNAIRAAFFTQTAQAHQQNGETPVPQATNTPAFETVAPTNAKDTPKATATLPKSSTPAATVPVVPASTPGLPATYTIHDGETAYCIARRFNVDQSELLSINNKPDNYLAMPDDVLKIPTSGEPFIGNRRLIEHTANMSYTVKAGQTNVYYVACAFGDVDPNRIIAANSLKKPYALTAGKKIVIP